MLATPFHIGERIEKRLLIESQIAKEMIGTGESPKFFCLLE